MSLGDLPDELVMKVFRYLATLRTGWHRDYMNLGKTCKRFLYISERHYRYITQFEPWFPEFALHSCDLDENPERLWNWIRSAPPKSTIPATYGLCPAHATSRDSEHCFYRGLYPLVTFKFMKSTKIRVLEYDLRAVTCMLALDDFRFDYITALSLSYCNLDLQNFASLLRKLKNLVSLELQINNYHYGPDCSNITVPVLERTLRYLLIADGYNGGSSTDHPLLHPNLKLSAEVARTHIYERFISYNLKYLERFRDTIKLIILNNERDKVNWPRLARQYGLQKIRCITEDDLLRETNDLTTSIEMLRRPN